jgi:hypothetical protein
MAEITLEDQAGYEASGVEKARESQMAFGGQTIAGYNKAESKLGTPPANRYLGRAPPCGIARTRP